MKLKKYFVFCVIGVFCLILSGCGETIGGFGKDASRITKGVKTIFVKDGGE